MIMKSSLLPSEAEEREIKRLNTVVDRFAETMKARFAAKVMDGASGWDDPDFLESRDIAFKAHGDMCAINVRYGCSGNSGFTKDDVKKMSVDVANRMMILWFRETE